MLNFSVSLSQVSTMLRAEGCSLHGERYQNFAFYKYEQNPQHALVKGKSRQ